MLVLSRKRNESIVIPISEATVIDSRGERSHVTFVEPIEVMVVDIRGNKVRLGVNAPMPIHVHREEVYRAINEGERQRRAEQLERMRTCL